MTGSEVAIVFLAVPTSAVVIFVIAALISAARAAYRGEKE
jgi:hypothetical protein